MEAEGAYGPPLTLTPALLNQVAAIAEVLGRWSAREERTLHLVFGVRTASTRSRPPWRSSRTASAWNR
jgi:hypothetical protein